MSQEKVVKEGDLVRGSSGRGYRVGEYLGEGVTSVVYEGRDEGGAKVALKVLRGDVGEMVADSFWREFQVLSELAYAEQMAGDGFCHVPRLLDGSRKGEVRFLALELVKGRPLDRVLEAPKSSYLSEEEALIVAEQVLRVLDLLHQQVRRTYTDFQLENIWLQRDEKDALLDIKVMGWNHVSDKWPDDQPLPRDFGAADLVRLAAYLYRMLTGKGADERGETEQALSKRAGERWEALSLGTRQVLVNALHPNPLRRYASAAHFDDAVQAQQALWEKDWTELLGEARQALREPHESHAWAERIAARLDMAARLGAPDEHVNYYRLQFESYVGHISPAWHSGKRYYEAEQYRSAAEKWRAEAQARGRVDLWRWVMLAEAGVQLGRERFAPIREPLEEAVLALNHQQWERAQKISQVVGKHARCAAVDALWADAWLHTKVQKAEEHELSENLQDWVCAVQAYQQAAKALRAIPYQSLIVEEIGSLDERAKEQEQRATKRHETKEALESITSLLQDDFEEGLRTLESHLQRDSSHLGLSQLCLSQGNRLLKAKKAEQAAALLGIGVLLARTPRYEADLRTSWLEARDMVRQQQAQQARAQRKEAQELAALLREVQQETEQPIRQLEALLTEERWHDFLKIAHRLPLRLLAERARWEPHIIKLNTRFTDVTRARLMPVAHTLRQVLDLLDRDPDAVEKRTQRYNEMMKKVQTDQAKWNQYIKRRIEEHRKTKTPAQYGEIIDQISRLLPLTEPDHPELKKWLQKTQRELQAAYSNPW